MFTHSIKTILGIDVRARRKEEDPYAKERFEKPLLQRNINGSETDVPLDVSRLWGWKKEL
ncbi:hypothetical protein [Aneurinibacillus tyrosinisolvens]|uniref:hypothetical protein n=1 Tax=Aneurinibacillus tyrosinisolvens TaxID=1443435 RepID=UPI00063F9776|nr:hypothetical protein [Aneurinibacillus tyrosinisolvens]